MNRVIYIILASILSSPGLATDMPQRCNGKEISDKGGEFETGLSMPASEYEVFTEFDGEVYYVHVSVPSSYKGLMLSRINLERAVSGSPVLAAGLSYKVGGNKAVSSTVLVWPSEIEAIGFNVTYANDISCSEGYSYTEKLSGYDLVYKHDK